jgi:hypothetical protein
VLYEYINISVWCLTLNCQWPLLRAVHSVTNSLHCVHNMNTKRDMSCQAVCFVVIVFKCILIISNPTGEINKEFGRFWEVWITICWNNLMSAAARLLGLWVPRRGHGCLSSCECCVLSGRGLCDKLVPRPEESYRVWCVQSVIVKPWKMRRPRPPRGCRAIEKNLMSIHSTSLKFILH